MATKKVSLSSFPFRGKTVWRVRYWDEHGILKRPQYSSKKEAGAKVAALKGQASHADIVWEMLSAAERKKVIAIYEGQLKSMSPSIGDVITELIQAKKNSGRSENYRDNLDSILGRFAKGRETAKVDSISVAQIESFLDGKNLASRATLRARLSTLFKFAVRRGYRSDNPCEALEAVTYVKPSPQIFTISQFSDAVLWLKKHRPEGLAWFALSTLCGLRPEEAEKTTKADIHEKEGWIKVEAQTTKVRQRRVVYPKPEAMRFLQWAMKKGKLPLPSNLRKKILSGSLKQTKKGPKRYKCLRQALGFKVWPKDITRHTAASYWLASDGSAAHVAEMLGNSEKVLKRDYKALVTRVEAEEFWKVVREQLKKVVV